MSPGVDVESLARAARDGDGAAFEALVVATSAELYGLALRLVGNEHDARDVVQETYLRAYRALGSFRGDASVRTWLFRICANRAASALTRRGRERTEALDERANEIAERRREALPDESAGTLDERVVLQRALRRLPATLRAVVVLHDVYDLPHAAIATELGISLAATKVRLHRARRQLRDTLAETRPRRQRHAPARALAASDDEGIRAVG